MDRCSSFKDIEKENLATKFYKNSREHKKRHSEMNIQFTNRQYIIYSRSLLPADSFGAAFE